MARHIFTPIARAANYRFVFNTFQESYSESRYAFHAPFKCFDTLGDGATAHTPDYALPSKLLVDYLYSLAEAMRSNPDLCDAVRYDIQSPVTDHQIEFAASVKYKDDGKERYYSVQEEAISIRPAKRHDRRWNRIEPHHNGGMMSILSVLRKDYSDMWDCYRIMAAVCKWYSANGRYVGSPAASLDWTTDKKLVLIDQIELLQPAYEACLSALAVHEENYRLDRGLNNYRMDLERSRAPKEVPQEVGESA
jgi:hypothetical protein